MRRRRFSQLALGGLLPLLPGAAGAASEAPVVVGLTAEFGIHGSASAQAIEQGLRLAQAEVNAGGGVLGGRPLRLLTRDDRSIPARAIRNFHEFLHAPGLVGVFGGKFSPVLLELEPLARTTGVPLFAPWCSADALTAGAAAPALVFRLALKDSWAVRTMAGHLVRRRAVRGIGLLAPNTAWGTSSAAALRRLSLASGLRHRIEWYNWGEKTLLPQYRALRAAGMDGLILVANEGEAALMLREMAALPAAQRMPVAAHAGAAGGDLFAMAGAALDSVDLAVVQTFSFAGRQTPVRRRVLRSLAADPAAAQFARVSTLGFAHAYDLMHLLARAVERAGTTDRMRVHAALETLPPYAGLVKTYARPFAPGRHDALGPEDVFMARFAHDGRLVRLEES